MASERFRDLFNRAVQRDCSALAKVQQLYRTAFYTDAPMVDVVAAADRLVKVSTEYLHAMQKRLPPQVRDSLPTCDVCHTTTCSRLF